MSNGKALNVWILRVILGKSTASQERHTFWRNQLVFCIPKHSAQMVFEHAARRTGTRVGGRSDYNYNKFSSFFIEIVVVVTMFAIISWHCYGGLAPQADCLCSLIIPQRWQDLSNRRVFRIVLKRFLYLLHYKTTVVLCNYFYKLNQLCTHSTLLVPWILFCRLLKIRPHCFRLRLAEFLSPAFLRYFDCCWWFYWHFFLLFIYFPLALSLPPPLFSFLGLQKQKQQQ